MIIAKRSKFKKQTKEYTRDSIFDIIDIEEKISQNKKVGKTEKVNFIYRDEKYIENKLIHPIQEKDKGNLEPSEERNINNNKFGININNLVLEYENGYTVPLIQKYTPIKLLGAGSFSIVIEAYDASINKNIAIKIIPKTKQRILNEYMKKEVQILSSLKHNNVIRFYDIIDNTSYAYIFTELMEGGSLKDLINERYSSDEYDYLFTDNECSVIMKGIMEGLYYIHMRDIIHRDIKPENIMFRRKGDLTSLAIVDFGLATHVNEEDNLKCGTPLFMAPEIINKEMYDQSVDVWAAGIVLYIICSGGMHPLYNEDMTHELFIEEIKKKKEWVFPDTFHLLARNLFLKLCKYYKSFRYQVNNSLKHPWITRVGNPIPTTLMESFSRIDMKKKFRSLLGTTIFLCYYKVMNKDLFLKEEEQTNYLEKQYSLDLSKLKGHSVTGSLKVNRLINLTGKKITHIRRDSMNLKNLSMWSSSKLPSISDLS